MTLERLQSWLIDRALPFWAERGYDTPRHRFRERLDWVGAPLDVPHRAMVQARQIYVYCQAAELGWYPDGLDLAVEAAATLDRCFAENIGDRTAFRFSIDRHGECVAARKDAYTQAFILLAHAWLYRLTKQPRFLQVADRLLDFIDGHLADPQHGGSFEDFPRSIAGKRQNPLMHLLEALIALDSAAPDRGYAARAECLAGFVRDNMFDSERGLLPEHFDDRLQIPAEDITFEPGHHFEWAWLLADLAMQSRGRDHRWGTVLDQTALRYGHADNGLIFDELGPGYRPTRTSHRLWPHCEAIKAAAVRHRRGDREARAMADRTAALMLEVFLDRPFLGGWIDHVAPDRRPLVDYVPASSLYHLTLATAVATETFGLSNDNTRTTAMGAR